MKAFQGAGYRRLEGVAHTDRARLFVSRILAVAQMHRDPLTLLHNEGRAEDLERFGFKSPGVWVITDEANHRKRIHSLTSMTEM